MTRITATYRVTSSMFLGGAEENSLDTDIRVPSFKGALRFWWRAAALTRHQGDWRAVRDEELTLLGAAERSIGQSRVLMSLAGQENMDVSPTGSPLNSGLAYLAGQGLYHFRDQMTRPALQPGKAFTLQLYLRRGVTAQQADALIQALRLLGACGGLGARTRRGLGSITLLHWEVNGERHTETLTTQRDLLTETLTAAQPLAPEPPYSAFSGGSRVLILKGTPKQSAEDLLEEVGQEMVRYRSYGQSARGGLNALNEPAEQNFKDDHDLMYDASRSVAPTESPERAVFGLPHNYFFSSSQPTVKAGVGPKRMNRRASPLLLHTQRRDGEPAAVVVTFLPAQFLPPGEEITIDVRRRTWNVPPRSGAALWEPIHTFLDRLMGQETPRGARRMTIAEAMEVRP